MERSDGGLSSSKFLAGRGGGGAWEGLLLGAALCSLPCPGHRSSAYSHLSEILCRRWQHLQAGCLLPKEPFISSVLKLRNLERHFLQGPVPVIEGVPPPPKPELDEQAELCQAGQRPKEFLRQTKGHTIGSVMFEDVGKGAEDPRC